MHRRVVALAPLVLLIASACSASDSGSADSPDPTSVGAPDGSVDSSVDSSVESSGPVVTDAATSADGPVGSASGDGSTDDFCAAVSAIQSSDFELEEAFGSEARELFEDVQESAPAEVADDVAVVVEALDSIAEIGVSADTDDPEMVDDVIEILFDPAFTEANENLEAYTSDACGIELRGGEDFDTEVSYLDVDDSELDVTDPDAGDLADPDPGNASTTLRRPFLDGRDRGSGRRSGPQF